MDDIEIIDFDDISTIKVAGQDPKITNQDSKQVYISKNGTEKKTSDFMLGNDHKELSDGDYISSAEFTNALREALSNKSSKKIIMKKTGKKINSRNLEKIIEEAKKAGTIILSENKKITNQDAREVKIQTPEMEKEKTVAGMFLGKNGVKLANGEYIKKSEIEFEVVDKKVVPVDKHSKKVKLMKGLATVATITGLIALLPFIMHANSVMWHHSAPMIQDMLHNINLGLGKLINATYTSEPGLWESFKGTLMNSDASTASLGWAVATYGATAAGLAKIVNDIKNGVIKAKNAIMENEEEKKGGKSR